MRSKFFFVQGTAQTDVASRAGVSVRTVRRVIAEDAVTHADDSIERRERKVGRPSKATPFAPKVSAWLAEDPALPTQELLRRAKDTGYSGKKTAFYALVSGLRPPQTAPVVRFEGLPGEFSQHDFGHVDVKFVDGRKVRVHFFASRLKYSRFARVTLVENERVETIMRSVARDFVEFGGLPLMAVFDRPKTIVKKGGKGRDVEEFNQVFAQAIVDIGVGVEMCAPRSGNQKGSVERLVGWVKGSFFKPRKFQDEEDLRAQLAAWHVEVNTQTPSRATGVIPEIRRQEELPRLRPVKVFPETLPLRIPVVVGPTAEVMFEGVPYSMPPKAAHVAGTLFLYEHELRIVAGRFEARHRRRTKGEPPAPLPEHRAAKIAAVHGARAKLYEKRQQVLNLGQDALSSCSPRSRTASRACPGGGWKSSTPCSSITVTTPCALPSAEPSSVDTFPWLAFVGALPSSARGGEGESHRRRAAQPRGDNGDQMEIAFDRAGPPGGVS